MRRPPPDYVIICSDDSEWKVHAQSVAELRKVMLLLGASDEAFIADLKAKHGLTGHVEHGGEQLLLWVPPAASRPRAAL